MNAGRGIEQLIAEWLVEEAAPGAPDRVLDSARHTVHRTNQRQFAAIWRESMFSPARLVAIAATLAIAVGAGAWIGRATAPIGPAAPISTPRPSATAAITLSTYRADRNAVCKKYLPMLEAQNDSLDGLYDPGLTEAQRAPKVAALTAIVAILEQTVTELDALAVPTDVVRDHDAQVGAYRGTISLIHQALTALAAGDVAGAQVLDVSTDTNSRAIEAFESKYSLTACP